MDSTTCKLENVCQHGFWIGQGAAPCPFCNPECYANGTQGVIAPLITVNLNTLLDSAKDARISALEAEVATAKKRAHAAEQSLGNERGGFLARIDELIERAVAAESALAAAREECERLRFQDDKGHRMVERLESELAALRASANDAGRVERLVAAMQYAEWSAGEYKRGREKMQTIIVSPDRWWVRTQHGNAEEIALATDRLAAADGREP